MLKQEDLNLWDSQRQVQKSGGCNGEGSGVCKGQNGVREEREKTMYRTKKISRTGWGFSIRNVARE